MIFKFVAVMTFLQQKIFSYINLECQLEIYLSRNCNEILFPEGKLCV